MHASKQGEVDSSLFYVKEKIHIAMNFFLNIKSLKQKIAIINMIIIFHFIFKVLKNPTLKVELFKLFIQLPIN